MEYQSLYRPSSRTTHDEVMTQASDISAEERINDQIEQKLR